MVVSVSDRPQLVPGSRPSAKLIFSHESQQLDGTNI